ncbi:hypothetical protein IE81DRAFT_323695 [Ceraceosorus guamensis]|uniref:Uncharacterized protein n=1 Tax=Ceraceosorus guamensis TaxID=1522189 RepID=A0A316W0H6_9BASI|nr:hypothetical protein IE81DRAFT_323695 [Ceraceosorus guamensis]PWN42213.1 hypothetical protein IE81DRAFT_323695 [Ceraceosorus guamensis]
MGVVGVKAAAVVVVNAPAPPATGELVIKALEGEGERKFKFSVATSVEGVVTDVERHLPGRHRPTRANMGCCGEHEGVDRTRRSVEPLTRRACGASITKMLSF